MERYSLLHYMNFPIIAALHLPAMRCSGAPITFSVSQIIEYSLRNVKKIYSAGIQTIYIQDVSDHPVPKETQPHTIANLASIGYEIKQNFPDIILGISLMSNGAKAPLAIAQACGAHFIRIKVYVGTMIKPEGIVEGCAYDAIQYRYLCEAEHIQILADVYDRTGEPLGRTQIGEVARQAVNLGRADGIVLTGGNYLESMNMLEEVKKSNINAPIFLGGGANAENLHDVLSVADGVIVNSSITSNIKYASGMPFELDEQKIMEFVNAID